MADLLINTKDALETWGVRMGDNFISAIQEPAPLKEFVENKSRLNDGKEVDVSNPKLDERDVTLVFNIEGDTESRYLSNYKSFVAELQKGKVDINVPVLGTEIYHLIFKKSSSFSMNRQRTFSKLSVKFNEPNPNNR